jgi:DNA polymerase-4
MEKQIVHIDLDSFFVSVERLQQPSLVGKPVLVGGAGDRGVVASCSYEARKYGIHSAMPMKMARMLCPEAIIVRGNTGLYSEYSHEVTKIISEAVPLYEKTSIDEFYMDLTGMDRFFGSYKLATEIRQKVIRETGLPISFALSSNKTVSKIGTGEAKPNGQMQIPHGQEKDFLAPMSVSKIPGVGEKTFEVLKKMGLEKIKTIQEMTIEGMERLLGQHGIAIWQKANGIYNSPIVPYSERGSLSSERTFEKDTTDADYLKSMFISMTEHLAYQMRGEERLTSCVTIKIRYSDFSTHTMQMRIPYTGMDHLLIEKVKELFGKLWERGQAIRLIGVKFSHLIQGTYQYNLFEDAGAKTALYQAMDKIRDRYGSDAVARAVGMDVEHYDFNPFGGGKKNIEKAAEQGQIKPKSGPGRASPLVMG